MDYCPNTHLFTYYGIHHITFWVGNALQAANMFCIRFGFEPLAYRGLETGHKDSVSHVIAHNDIILNFESSFTDEIMADHIKKHGDGIRDIAFFVNDCKAAFEYAVICGGAEGLVYPHEIVDESGSVLTGTIKMFADTTITFIENQSFVGKFLPNYGQPRRIDPLLTSLPSVSYEKIDHVVGCHHAGQAPLMEEKYRKWLGLEKFSFFDETQIHSKVSALRSVVMANHTERDPETIKILATEPVSLGGVSQIQEFINFYQGEGIQHVALLTSNIITTVASLHRRGVEFLAPPPKSYYDNLRTLVKDSSKCPSIKEDIDTLEQLHLLLDYDDKGYLLQILSRPLQDRPTFFIEIIERHGHKGFGQGNFKSLFQAIENDQAARNTLFPN